MNFFVNDDPRELLRRSGYEQYGLNTYSWRRIIGRPDNNLSFLLRKKLKKPPSQFHAIIDYNYPIIRLHIDCGGQYNRNGDVVRHKTKQKGHQLVGESRIIKRATFNGKMEHLKEKIFKILDDQLNGKQY